MRGTSFVFGLVVASVFQTTPQSPRNLGEITVERINVVDKNGTLRMVISNKDRQHPGVIDGVTLDRPRPVAGMLFFNDAGDEVGGLTFAGKLPNAPNAAEGTFTFDQLHQDQTIGLMYSENNGRRTVGLNVWDRPDQRLADVIRRQAEAQPGHRRVFVGKGADKSAVVSLADGNGRPRLNLTVDASGSSRIELLDENGKVTNRWPAQ